MRNEEVKVVTFKSGRFPEYAEFSGKGEKVDHEFVEIKTLSDTNHLFPASCVATHPAYKVEARSESSVVTFSIITS